MPSTDVGYNAPNHASFCRFPTRGQVTLDSAGPYQVAFLTAPPSLGSESELSSGNNTPPLENIGSGDGQNKVKKNPETCGSCHGRKVCFQRPAEAAAALTGATQQDKKKRNSHASEDGFWRKSRKALRSHNASPEEYKDPITLAKCEALVAEQMRQPSSPTGRQSRHWRSSHMRKCRERLKEGLTQTTKRGKPAAESGCVVNEQVTPIENIHSSFSSSHCHGCSRPIGPGTYVGAYGGSPVVLVACTSCRQTREKGS